MEGKARMKAYAALKRQEKTNASRGVIFAPGDVVEVVVENLYAPPHFYRKGARGVVVRPGVVRFTFGRYDKGGEGTWHVNDDHLRRIRKARK